jgi:hypothetical protein
VQTNEQARVSEPLAVALHASHRIKKKRKKENLVDIQTRPPDANSQARRWQKVYQ